MFLFCPPGVRGCSGLATALKFHFSVTETSISFQNIEPKTFYTKYNRLPYSILAYKAEQFLRKAAAVEQPFTACSSYVVCDLLTMLQSTRYKNKAYFPNKSSIIIFIKLKDERKINGVIQMHYF